ncbi:hypothetical protein FG386_000844 [Cryptosporidium ryanae]|uniref:uncharacterized protein n=1 Tax=Cryptosporidium ryanae TaxID=515981 RepID=UPI00351A2B8E|nr:hypothetical protein FG386_000844 [Cryptosporidium ryanae]
MTFQCCLNSDQVVNDTELQKVETKIPKKIDLNDGYYNNIEFLIFKKRPYTNFNIQESVTPEIFRPVYNSTPITLLEAKVSSNINAELGCSVAESTSSVVITGKNSPIQLFTRIDIPLETCQNANSDIPCLNHNPSQMKEHMNILVGENQEKLNYCKTNELNLNNEFESKNKTNNIKSEKNFELTSYEVKNPELKDISSDFDHDQITNKINENDEIRSDYIDIKSIKNDICDLIQLSNKLLEKKTKSNNKKTKKTINIEITLTPKSENNVFINSYKSNKNNTSDTKYDINNLSDKKNNDYGLITVYSENNTSKKELYKDDELRIQELETDLAKNDELDILKFTNKTRSNNKLIQNFEQSNIPYKNEMLDLFTSRIDRSEESNEVEIDKATDLRTDTLNKSSSISSDKFIPFIEDYESFKTDNEKTGDEIEMKNNSKINNDFFNSNKEKDVNNLSLTSEKVDNNFPSINFDPQFAQLFASAQIHIDEIKKNQLTKRDNDCFIEESDPVKIIKSFIEDPCKNRNQISWSTVKAAIDVYKPQVEYATKELEKWKNCDEKDKDTIKDNIEYYSDLLEELKEKIELAERAKLLIVRESNEDEIDKMLEVEYKYIEEIKEKMRDNLNELKIIEDEYLNGKTENKESVILIRKKVKELEKEIKDKLVQIHKLKSLKNLHENL